MMTWAWNCLRSAQQISNKIKLMHLPIIKKLIKRTKSRKVHFEISLTVHVQLPYFVYLQCFPPIYKKVNENIKKFGAEELGRPKRFYTGSSSLYILCSYIRDLKRLNKIVALFIWWNYWDWLIAGLYKFNSFPRNSIKWWIIFVEQFVSDPFKTYL